MGITYIFSLLLLLATYTFAQDSSPQSTPEEPESTPEEPQGTPEEPEQSYPEEPTASTPEEPTASTPEEPTASTPEEPSTSYPEEPTASPPEEPSASTPEEPSTSYPEEPSASTPEEPSSSYPEEPSASYPEEPESSPEEPESTPEQPSASYPEEPESTPEEPESTPEEPQGTPEEPSYGVQPVGSPPTAVCQNQSKSLYLSITADVGQYKESIQISLTGDIAACTCIDISATFSGQTCQISISFNCPTGLKRDNQITDATWVNLNAGSAVGIAAAANAALGVKTYQAQDFSFTGQGQARYAGAGVASSATAIFGGLFMSFAALFVAFF